MELKNSRVLITGGSSGIGRAIAATLKAAGAQVMITGRNKERLARAASDLSVLAESGDVSREEDVLRCFAAVQDRLGGLDCLINNAGVGVHRPLIEMTADEMQRVWAVNVLGAMLMAREAAKLFIAQRSGNIINISSTSGTRGYENGTPYVASKFALRGMGECWRAELRRHNIRVMTINPSEVTTAFGNAEGKERPEQPNKLRSIDIAHAVRSALELDDRGFVPELTVFATNPW